MSNLKSRSDIRETMTKAGSWLPVPLYLAMQQLITEITGRAPRDVPALIELTSLARQLITLSVMLLSLVAIHTLTSSAMVFGLAFVPIFWLYIAVSLRTAQVSFTHYASHYTLLSHHWLNDVVGELWSVVNFSQPLWLYRMGHLVGHHRDLNSPVDPDATFFEDNGFVKGQSLHWYRKHMLKTVFSPSVHWRMFKSRMNANFRPFYSIEQSPLEHLELKPSRIRVLTRFFAGVAIHVSVAGLAFTSGYGALYLLGYVVPVTVGYQILSLFQNATEHQPGIVPGQSELLRGQTKFTGARYFGTAYQEAHPVRWWLSMVFVALPQKLLTVGPTELQLHNIHHDPKRVIFELSDNCWAMAPYVARKAEMDYGIVYKETWGLKDALDESFMALAAMK